MPLILHIETATDVCSIGLARKGRILGIRESEEKFQHAAGITLLIEACCDEANIDLDEIDAVAVSKGPGSFTALRIGISTAKGICYALGKPLLSVDTLQALAYGAVKALDKKPNTYYPMIDARRMEVYTASFNSDLEQLTLPEAVVIEPATFADRLEAGEEIVLTGNGAQKCEQVLAHPGLQFLPLECSAKFMFELAEKAFLDGRWEDLAYFEPFYLKPPNITKPKKKF